MELKRYVGFRTFLITQFALELTLVCNAGQEARSGKSASKMVACQMDVNKTCVRKARRLVQPLSAFTSTRERAHVLVGFRAAWIPRST
jgi:hypothetical protein